MYQLQHYTHTTSLHYLKNLQVCKACSNSERLPGLNNGDIMCTTTDCVVYYDLKGSQEKLDEAHHQVRMALAQLNDL